MFVFPYSPSIEIQVELCQTSCWSPASRTVPTTDNFNPLKTEEGGAQQEQDKVHNSNSGSVIAGRANFGSRSGWGEKSPFCSKSMVSLRSFSSADDANAVASSMKDRPASVIPPKGTFSLTTCTKLNTNNLSTISFYHFRLMAVLRFLCLLCFLLSLFVAAFKW